MFAHGDDDRMLTMILIVGDIHDIHEWKMEIVDLDAGDEDGHDDEDVEEEK